MQFKSSFHALNLLEEGMDELLVINVGKGLATSVEGSLLREANHVVDLSTESLLEHGIIKYESF